MADNHITFSQINTVGSAVFTVFMGRQWRGSVGTVTYNAKEGLWTFVRKDFDRRALEFFPWKITATYLEQLRGKLNSMV